MSCTHNIITYSSIVSVNKIKVEKKKSESNKYIVNIPHVPTHYTYQQQLCIYSTSARSEHRKKNRKGILTIIIEHPSSSCVCVQERRTKPIHDISPPMEMLLIPGCYRITRMRSPPLCSALCIRTIITIFPLEQFFIFFYHRCDTTQMCSESLI